MVIYSFEFEECVLAAYNSEPVECTVHGQLELKELAPDAVCILVLGAFSQKTFSNILYLSLLTIFRRERISMDFPVTYVPPGGHPPP